MSAADPWAIGTPITVDHPLHAVVVAEQSIENTLHELGVPDAASAARSILARLARLDPPVLLCHPDELRETE